MPKSPDITSGLLSFWMFQQFVFLCSYDLYLWKSVFLSGCKINNKIDSNQKKSSFLRKKERKRLQVLPPQQGSFCNKKSKNIRFYFVLFHFSFFLFPFSLFRWFVHFFVQIMLLSCLIFVYLCNWKFYIWRRKP